MSKCLMYHINADSDLKVVYLLLFAIKIVKIICLRSGNKQFLMIFMAMKIYKFVTGIIL